MDLYSDQYFMNEAYKQAQLAFDEGEIPVGAVVVCRNKIIARAYNQTEKLTDVTAHAEILAITTASNALGAKYLNECKLYVTLEPCAHKSARGPDCAGLVAASGIAEAVIGIGDPDPRTADAGIAKLEAAGAKVRLAGNTACRESLAGYLCRAAHGRPYVTLKLATSLDGCIALDDGSSRWITGKAARAHAHMERARADAILVGGGTLRADDPSLDVRLPGLEARSPQRLVLTRGEAPPGWTSLASPHAVRDLPGAQYLLVEGGAQTAAAFLAADLVDRLLLYRAPILLGSGKPALGDIGLLFPPSDPAFAGLDSREIVAAVLKRVSEAAPGVEVLNVAAVVTLDSPKLGPLREQVAASVAKLMCLSATKVGVTFKTSEGLAPDHVQASVTVLVGGVEIAPP